MEKRHVVITGGGSGVGAALAQAFVDHGDLVTIIGRRKPALEAVAQQHPAIQTAVADVTDRHALEDAIANARKTHGPVNIAIANAGIAASAPFGKITEAAFDEIMAINLKGAFSLFQTCLPDMETTKSGRLIAIASILGLTAGPYVAHYTASKHALVGLTKAVAMDVAGHDITANAICPGYIDTPMTERTIANIMEKTGKSRQEAIAAVTTTNPQGKLISPSEVAATALWLASGAAQAVNGQAIAMNGGPL